MLLKIESKRGATPVVKIWVEEDVMGYYLVNSECFAEAERVYCSYAGLFFNQFRPENPVTLFTSEDVRLEAYRNMPHSWRGDFCDYMTHELGITITAFGGDDDDQKFLELAKNSDTLTPLETSILKNIMCLLKQDCEAVITCNDKYADIYRRFLQNYDVSILLLSEDFNMDIIQNARYEWIERHLTSAPPNLALANDMIYEVLKRFAEDSNKQLNVEFLAFPPDGLGLRLIITRIDTRLDNALQHQSQIFQSASKNYNMFCQQVGWSEDDLHLSKAQLQARLSEPSLSPGFFPFILHRDTDQEPSQLQEIYRQWFLRLNRIFS